MTKSLKWLAAASLVNLVGNSLGTVVAFQHHLTAGFGSFLPGDVNIGYPSLAVEQITQEQGGLTPRVGYSASPAKFMSG